MPAKMYVLPLPAVVAVLVLLAVAGVIAWRLILRKP